MPLLTAENVTKRFGGLVAVNSLSFDIEQGAIVSVIGPNGAGKTTLFNSISGFVRLASGKIEFKGRDVTSLTPSRRTALGIGRSFQTPSLIGDASVEVNVLAAQNLQTGYRLWDVVFRPWRQSSGERRVRHRAATALEQFGLRHERDELASDLSFGFTRWTELAGLLASGAELLLLDEPTTGLDRGESERLAGALRRARADGRTILVVAHDVHFVLETCDLVHALAEGSHIVSGKPREVCSHPTVIEHYLGKQRI